MTACEVALRAERLRRHGLNALAGQAYDEAAAVAREDGSGGLAVLYRSRAVVERSLACRR